MIKQIADTSVNKICSSQAVYNLSIAIKELLENSLDAQSSIINIHILNVSDFIVSDNGSGISLDNHSSLALKHHTSKISLFNHLENLSSFGFRGEAISSIANISSSLVVTTRTSDSDIGYKLVYNQQGELTSSTQTHRQVGTTVHVQGIFSTLSVRYAEFQRSSKREIAKAISIIQSYALIQEIRISCKLESKDLFSTSAISIPANISCIFPSTQFNEISLPLNIKNCISINGYISSPFNSNRGSPDRQFWFVNKRPVLLNKFTRVINEIAKEFQKGHLFWVLDFTFVGFTSVDLVLVFYIECYSG